MTYETVLKRIENLQRELMDIPDYDEEVYQSIQQVINILEDLLEEQ